MTTDGLKHRIQLDLSPASIGRLQALRERTEAASYAEVIRNALNLYAALVVEHDSGGALLSKQADGSTKEYILPGLVNGAATPSSDATSLKCSTQ